MMARNQLPIGSLEANDLQWLQRSVGNQAVQRMVNQVSLGTQGQLTVGPAADKYEDEANQVANHVTKKQHRSTVAGGKSKSLQRMASAEGGPVNQEVEGSIRQAQGGGRSLDRGVQRQMEQGFGADFSGVNVHTDGRADTLNQSLNARAFTTGQDIFFKRGEYRPGTSDGQHLLAHELTHVVQQSGGSGHAQRSPHLQRFSNADAQQGAVTDWAGETASVTKSEGGAVSGVFFMHDRNGNTIIVKPQYSDALRGGQEVATNATQMQFGDKALSAMGLKTPDSRIVAPGSPEFQPIIQAIIAQLELPGQEGVRGAPPDIVERLGKVKFFKVMASASGKTIQKVSQEVNSKETADRFFAKISANKFAFARNLGKIMASDAAIGNDDRLSSSMTGATVNTGNYFVDDEGNFELIDSEATLGKPEDYDLDERGAFYTPSAELMNPLFDKNKEGVDKVEVLAMEFFKTIIEGMHKGKQTADGFDLKGYVESWLNNGDNKSKILAAVRDGINEGLLTLGQLMNNKEQMKSLKSETSAYGDESGSQVWKTFKARGRYLMGRAGGMEKDDAALESQIYQGYKYGVAPSPEVKPLNDEVVNIAPKKRKGLKKLFGKKSKKPSQVGAHLETDNLLRDNRIINEKGAQPFSRVRRFDANFLRPLNEQTTLANGNKKKLAEIAFLKKCVDWSKDVQSKQGEILQHLALVERSVKYLSRFGQVNGREARVARESLRGYMQGKVINELDTQVGIYMSKAIELKGHLNKSNPRFGQSLVDFAKELRMTLQKLMNKVRLAALNGVVEGTAD